jgi:hypothetical protein
VRLSPWDFLGIFPTKEEAEAKARKAGAGYVVRYGENRAGSDDFVWSSTDNPGT